jgi:hypothetical protein
LAWYKTESLKFKGRRGEMEAVNREEEKKEKGCIFSISRKK